MSDKLLKLLNEKIDVLKAKTDDEEIKIEEIQHLNGIIKTLKNDPFSICNLEEKQAKYIAEVLDLGEDYFETVKKYKVIHDGYLQFGRESIPQIEMVEAFIEDAKTKLDSRKLTLSDEVAQHQYTIIQFEQHKKLSEELTNPEKIVSKMNLLFKLLDESDFAVQERNVILLDVNSKNNAIYEKMLETTKEETVEISEYDDMIEEINSRLKKNFNPTILNRLISISDLLSSCETRNELDTVIEGWKYSFGDESIVKIIDGLLDLKKIDFLTLKELAKEEKEENIDEINKIDMQMGLLKEYRNRIQEANELEEESISVDTTIGKVEQALIDYEADPLKTPNCVLFISDAVDRDVKTINDDETLEDIFLLIEQLKTDNVEMKKKLDLKGNLESIRPKSLGKQARVVFTRLSDNVYGILHVTGKKSDNPKDWIATLNSRRKNSNVEGLRKSINNPEILNYYVTRTIDISNRLKNKVSAIYGAPKETVVSGGAK